MLLLGVVVGRGSTALDDWFLRGGSLFGAHRAVLPEIAGAPVMIAVVLAAALGALWQRRWRVAVVVATFPPAAVLLARVLKVMFGREKGGSLAYPSGHTTLMVVALGMGLLVVGWRGWLVAAAAVWAALGILGLAATYHYFTDTVGAVLLGSSIVVVAVRISHRRPAGLQRGGVRSFDR